MNPVVRIIRKTTFVNLFRPVFVIESIELIPHKQVRQNKALKLTDAICLVKFAALYESVLTNCYYRHQAPLSSLDGRA